MKLFINFIFGTILSLSATTSVLASEAFIELNRNVLTCNQAGALEWAIDSSLLQVSGEHEHLTSAPLPSLSECQSLRSIWINEFTPGVHVTYSVQSRTYERCHPLDQGCGRWVTVETLSLEFDGVALTSRDSL